MRKTRQGVRDLNPPKQKNERVDNRTKHDLCHNRRFHGEYRCHLCGYREDVLDPRYYF